VLHVAIDANCLAWGWGGIPKHVDRIARELVEFEGVEITLLANSRKPFARIPGAREVFARVKGGGLWRNLFVLPWLRRNRPDVFWAPEGLTPSVMPVPLVLTVHDLATTIFPATKPLRSRFAYRFSIPRAARTARRIICVSRTTADDVRQLWKVSEDAIRIIPNGIDDQFTPGDRAKAIRAVRERFGIEPPFVLAVGALEARKGLELLVDTAVAGDRAGRGFQFVFAGVPGFRSKELIARAAGRCTLLGHVSDEELVNLYRAADVLAAPSLYEGFGLTPLEAMACGTPAVVAGGSGGLEEISGGAALVVRERRADAWLPALEEAISRRHELTQAGLRLATRFRWPQVAAEVAAVLHEAARER
jgi:glycosyltransferase involved in cell wall biosynthesis